MFLFKLKIYNAKSFAIVFLDFSFSFSTLIWGKLANTFCVCFMDASCSMGASLYFMLMLHVTLDTCDQCRMNFIELTENIFVWKTFSYPGISSVKAKNICFRENSNDGSKRLSMKAKHFICFRKNTNDESKRAHGIFALQAIKIVSTFIMSMDVKPATCDLR